MNPSILIAELSYPVVCHLFHLFSPPLLAPLLFSFLLKNKNP